MNGAPRGHGRAVIAIAALAGVIACGEMPWQNRPSCTSTFEPPTRTLNVLFWHAAGPPSDLTLSFDDQPLGGRLRIHAAQHVPALAAECQVAIPARAGNLRACAVRSRRCTVLPLPAKGDLWVQLHVEDPDSVVLGSGAEPMPPAID
jgi:hypothetical protein